MAIFVGVVLSSFVKIYLQCLRLFEESLKNANKKISPADRKKSLARRVKGDVYNTGYSGLLLFICTTKWMVVAC